MRWSSLKEMHVRLCSEPVESDFLELKALTSHMTVEQGPVRRLQIDHSLPCQDAIAPI